MIRSSYYILHSVFVFVLFIYYNPTLCSSRYRYTAEELLIILNANCQAFFQKIQYQPISISLILIEPIHGVHYVHYQVLKAFIIKILLGYYCHPLNQRLGCGYFTHENTCLLHLYLEISFSFSIFNFFIFSFI